MVHLTCRQIPSTWRATANHDYAPRRGASRRDSNARDAHHRWAVRQAGQLDPPFTTCEAVLSECHFLLRNLSGGQRRLVEFMGSDRLRVSFSYADHASRIHELMRTYSDLPMSFADAWLVRMSESRDDSRVFTVDSDFRVYRRHGTEAIPVLMPE